MHAKNLLPTLALLAGCAGLPGEDVEATGAELGGGAPGAVFTMTNETQNRVLAFARGADGRLGAAAAFATGGAGSGDSLGSQGALALSGDRRHLLVVNAGSNQLTSFAVRGAELELRARVSSGGLRPVSVAERHGIVYVLNAGGAGNVSGFRLDAGGALAPIDGSTRALSAANAAAAQVVVSPDARSLVVTEKGTHRVDVFPLDDDGRAGDAVVYASAGRTPFGFEMTRDGRVIVSEAGTGSASSYDLALDGTLTSISRVIPDTQAAPCWLVVSQDDRFAFVANAGSSSISSYAIDERGAIELLDPRAGEVGPGSRPLDMSLGGGGRFLYVVDRGNLTVAGLMVHDDGVLEPLAAAGTLPPFTTGIAAF